MGREIALAGALLATLFVSAPAHAAERIYEVLYDVQLLPERHGAQVTLRLKQPRAYARRFEFHVEPQRQSDFAGDGTIVHEEGKVAWTPPERGGRLEWFANLESRRRDGAYDGMVTGEWAVFRGDDLVPPARLRQLKGAESRSRLRFRLPRGWSAVAPYARGDDELYEVVHEERSFDRPTGWMALGRLGVRWTNVAHTRMAVAGPVGVGLRHHDILAFLRWVVPTLRGTFPGFTRRLLVVGAGDPMWRGGLSAPASVYLHADRPLISENGTSTLLHELVHVAMGLRAERGSDWIVEGLAELYSLEFLRRSGTIGGRDYRNAVEHLREWGKNVDDLFTRRSSAASTARAVIVLLALDAEIRARTGGARSLDDLARELAGCGTVSFADLSERAQALAGGGPLAALASASVPGAPRE
jgi:hypothetical protein